MRIFCAYFGLPPSAYFPPLKVHWYQASFLFTIEVICYWLCYFHIHRRLPEYLSLYVDSKLQSSKTREQMGDEEAERMCDEVLHRPPSDVTNCTALYITRWYYASHWFGKWHWWGPRWILVHEFGHQKFLSNFTCCSGGENCESQKMMWTVVRTNWRSAIGFLLRKGCCCWLQSLWCLFIFRWRAHTFGSGMVSLPTSFKYKKIHKFGMARCDTICWERGI